MRSYTASFAIAITLASFLLFAIEPLIGKRLLPLLGGSAAVWTTCLVFFQTALLLGYWLAHWMATRLAPRRQALAYGALLLLGVAQWAVATQIEVHASTAHPIFSVLWLLTSLIGIPFVALSATSPLLQAWYARRAVAANVSLSPPYWLYALSNAGSLIALLAYPLIFEPNWGLHAQNLAWLGGLCAMTAISVIIIATQKNVPGGRAIMQSSLEAGYSVPGQNRLVWILLAFCGSLLLCAMTNHLTQNVAPIPLLWVIPLIAYLLSFVLAFGSARIYFRPVTLVLLLTALIVIAFFIYDPFATDETHPFWYHLTDAVYAIPILSVCLLIGCFVCHAELYRLRPSPRHMTAFYLSVAGGGALGAIFVGGLAPVIFKANYELTCALIVTAALMAVVTQRGAMVWRALWPVATVGLVVFLFVYMRHYDSDVIVRERSFYGSMRVLRDSDELNRPLRTLMHGKIEHGNQYIDPDRAGLPTSYYTRDSGVGIAIDSCCGSRPRRIGVIGLGTGTIAAYGRAGDQFRFYEIDRKVERLARTQFHYLADSQAKIEIVLGDARLSLASEPPQRFDVLAVDAFSGDAIPVHLLTAEAFELYRRHLAPGGILAIHISNKYVRLGPPVALQAQHAGMALLQIDTEDDLENAEFSSTWLLVTSNLQFLGMPQVQAARGDSKVETMRGLRLWTDDYSTLLPLLKLRRSEE
jgi:spermidine synthase